MAEPLHPLASRSELNYCSVAMKNLPEDLFELIEFEPHTLRVTSREGKHREFKQQINQRQISRYTKALAAFSNTDGGVLIFGVTDTPRHIVGVDPAEFPDEAQWSDCLNRDYAPEIDYTIREYEIANHTVIAIGVDRAKDLPIVCLRDNNFQREVRGVVQQQTLSQKGSIYYRRAGQTRPIYYAELKAILEKRDEERLQAFLQNLKIISDVGPDKIGILDMSERASEGDATRLYLSRETARNLNFIERGRFVESPDDGDPAYVVVGNVHLNQVVAGPLDPADQNLPTDAANSLRPFIHEFYLDGMPFNGQHVARLAKFSGIRGQGDSDQRYCIQDGKVNRVYYTRAGIQKLREMIEADPESALRSFASKATIDQYESLR